MLTALFLRKKQKFKTLSVLLFISALLLLIGGILIALL